MKGNLEKALGEKGERLRELAHKANRQNESPPEPFDSWFEVDVALQIAARGYRVIPQYPVIENKRIDLVVEGLQSRLAVECDGDYWHGPDKYDEDAERQRKLERCGWTFYRIRESAFHYCPEETMDGLWHVLEHHGIHPVGFTAPDSQTNKEGTSGEQNINVDQNESGSSLDSIFNNTVATEDEETDTHSPEKRVSKNQDSLVSEPYQNTPVIPEKESIESEPNNTISKNLFSQGKPLIKQAPYNTFEGMGLDEPRSSHKGKIAEGLYRIVEMEGPMLVKKAYDIYLRKCGIRRLGGELKRTMNKAMQYAISSEKIVKEDELGQGGLIYSIVRIKNSPPIKLRKLGTRQFDEIPPSELQVASFIVKRENRELSDEEHLRDVLTFYGLKRLTSAVKSTFKEANKVRFSYVNEFISQNCSSSGNSLG
jgi:very-short-patch-repair endonuclease